MGSTILVQRKMEVSYGRSHDVSKLANIVWAQVAPVEGVQYIPYGHPVGSIRQVDVPNCFRRQAIQASYFIDFESVTFSVEAFTDGVAASGSLLELKIKRGLRLT